jgi:hypothetical protein
MKNTNQAGKGDKYRPVDKKKYDDNYEAIRWNSNKKNNSKNTDRK